MFRPGAVPAAALRLWYAAACRGAIAITCAAGCSISTASGILRSSAQSIRMRSILARSSSTEPWPFPVASMRRPSSRPSAGVGAYRTRIPLAWLQPLAGARRWRFEIGAAHHYSLAFLDGVPIGAHGGGFTRFSHDVDASAVDRLCADEERADEESADGRSLELASPAPPSAHAAATARATGRSALVARHAPPASARGPARRRRLGAAHRPAHHRGPRAPALHQPRADRRDRGLHLAFRRLQSRATCTRGSRAAARLRQQGLARRVSAAQAGVRGRLAAFRAERAPQQVTSSRR